jgi:hypothetical protein
MKRKEKIQEIFFGALTIRTERFDPMVVCPRTKRPVDETSPERTVPGQTVPINFVTMRP